MFPVPAVALQIKQTCNQTYTNETHSCENNGHCACVRARCVAVGPQIVFYNTSLCNYRLSLLLSATAAA